jgi:oligosaccharyltransferase complex subunit alpha (ribophorin I)
MNTFKLRRNQPSSNIRALCARQSLTTIATMRLLLSLPCFLACAISALADSNGSKPLSSRQILPSTFTPPQVFENVNLVRNINLEKGYPREMINVVIKNVDSKPQSEYYLPFEADLISRIGGLEVRDKKDTKKPPFTVEVTEYDTERYIFW